MTDKPVNGQTFRSLLQSRPSAAVLIIAVWLIAVGGPLGHTIPNASHTPERFALIVGVAALYTVAMRGVERLRRATAGGQYEDFMNVWAIAAALLLSPAAAALAIAVIYTFVHRTWQLPTLWRSTFVAATTITGGYVAAMIHAAMPGRPFGLLAASVGYVVVQALLLFSAMYLAGAGQQAARALSSAGSWFVNLSTAAIGGTLVYASVHQNWWGAAAIVLVSAAIQQLAQHLQLVVDEAVDRDTGSLTSEPWRRLAEQLFLSTQRWTIVLIDPHAADRLGSVALVAGMLSEDGELLGRVDGRVAQLVRGPRVIANNVALRVQADLEAIGVECSVGVGSGATVEEQLWAAQAELVLGRVELH